MNAPQVTPLVWPCLVWALGDRSPVRLSAWGSDLFDTNI